MASKQSEQLVTYYKSVIGALAVNPEMPLDEMRAMFEHMGDVTAEPGGVDYIETDAGGVPALWAVPKGSTQDTGTVVLAWRRLRDRIDVHTSQGVWTPRQGDWLPRADRELWAGAGECASGSGQRYGKVVQMAAGSGDQAWAYRVDRRFGGRRPGGYDASPGPRTGAAAAGGDDADLTLA